MCCTGHSRAGVRSCLRRTHRTYLVVFDGDDWADVVPMRARSVTEIATSHPEATVLEHRPVWMSVQEYDRLRCEARGLDEGPRASAT